MNNITKLKKEKEKNIGLGEDPGTSQTAQIRQTTAKTFLEQNDIVEQTIIWICLLI